MALKTGIEWTDTTWNPIRGCSRVSEGCRNCYAESVAYRFSGAGQPYAGLAVLKNGHASWTGKVELIEKHLLDPLKWGPIVTGCLTGRELPVAKHGHCVNCTERPRRIFVNSMSDLFHENVPDEWIDRIFAVMALCPQHQFQVLTKRPKRMLAYLSSGAVQRLILHYLELQKNGGMATKQVFRALDVMRRDKIAFEFPLPNLRLGVSVEDQAAADARLDYLCALDDRGWATMVSFEPLLGAVDPGPWWRSLGERTWAIVGGESGPHARPMHPDWAQSLRDQCAAAGVPFFFKQWGEWAPGSEFWEKKTCAVDEQGRVAVDALRQNYPKDASSADGWEMMRRAGKHAAGALLDGVEHKAFPQAKS